MPRAPKKPVSLADLPVLTELPEAEVPEAELPVLTEVLAQEAPAAAKPAPRARSQALELTDEQCRQVAEYIAPQLEALLRSRIAARLDTLWPEIWKDMQADLPDMIRSVIIESGRRTRK